jgi:hypothetical protein
MAAMGTKSNSKAGVSQAVDVAYWHLADNPAALAFVRYWSNSGQPSILAGNGLSGFDPTATLAVHCGNDFYAGFSPYQNTRLSRYNAVS